MDDPSRFLVQPAEPEASISGGFVNPLDLINLASPSAWINVAITELTGTDVFSWMTEWVSGDWAALLAVAGQRPLLNELRDRYHKAAVGAWELASQLGNILQTLADRAIIAGIAAAGGTVTAGSGIGAIVGYGVATLVVTDMLRLINLAATKIQAFGTVILGLFGAGMDAAYQGGDLSTVPLPAAAYQHPAL